jgi:hypothetical protein
LNKPWIACRLREAPGAVLIVIVDGATALTRREIKSMVGRRIIEQELGWEQLRIDMVPDVEEVRVELEAVSFADREILQEGNVPILKARPTDDVSAGISESAEDGVCNESARIEYRSGETGLSVRIANTVGPR